MKYFHNVGSTYELKCWFTLLVLLFVLGILQLIIFRAFVSVPPDPKSEKNPVNELIKILALF